MGWAPHCRVITTKGTAALHPYRPARGEERQGVGIGSGDWSMDEGEKAMRDCAVGRGRYNQGLREARWPGLTSPLSG